jgi:hypothetical protein
MVKLSFFGRPVVLSHRTLLDKSGPYNLACIFFCSALGSVAGYGPVHGQVSLQLGFVRRLLHYRLYGLQWSTRRLRQ